MFFDIKELQQGKVRFQESFPPGSIEFSEPQLRQAAPIEVAGTAEMLASILEIRVKGRIQTRMEVACDRCLEPAAFPIDTDFNLVYQPSAQMPKADEVAIADRDSEVGFYEGNGLELADVVREQILLSLPMQRICREDCKGICPVCGQNRNTVECGCHEELVDDRWSGLKSL